MLLSTPMCRLMLVLQTPGYAAFTAMWSSFHSRASCRTVSMMAMQRKRVRLIRDWLISLLYSMIRSGTMWSSFHSRASCLTVSMLAKQWKRVNEDDWLIKNLIVHVQYDTPHSPLCDSFSTVGQAVVLSACWLSSGKEWMKMIDWQRSLLYSMIRRIHRYVIVFPQLGKLSYCQHDG